MFAEFFQHLSSWSGPDLWTVVVAALAAMACALPGNYLLLRRQSMMGDALSHTALLGIVVAFLLAHRWLPAEGISPADRAATLHTAMFVGAIVVGVLCAVLTETIHKLGRVESTAALGVVFTTMFALGLLLIRVAADSVHIDPDCVLYGTVETAFFDTVGGTNVPRAAVTNGAMLAVNGLLVLLCYKELKISAFDPDLSTALGISSRLVHYALMAVTAATLVAAFESVGSILVIAMLIVPPAAAHLLTDRLSRMILLSLVIAGLSAVLGHALATTLPEMIFRRLGYPMVKDASTAGMMAVACGGLFLLAMLCGPRHGLLSKFWHRGRLRMQIVAEDVLGLLYRREEDRAPQTVTETGSAIRQAIDAGPLLFRLAARSLRRRGLLKCEQGLFRLTESGRTTAAELVRAHRLWEAYMEKHFALPGDHLHDMAARVEHFLDPELRQELAAELDLPEQDPHGRAIPAEGENGGPETGVGRP